MNLPSISVVIPCHNEEESIESVVGAIPQGVLEIIVVDNNSSDRTAELARAAGARVVQESKQGYGAAMLCGFHNAQGDVIVTLDGDNQYPADRIIDLVQHLSDNNLDFISASRLPLDNQASMPWVRRLGNWGLTLVTNVLFNLRMHDSQSGMWIFRKEILTHIPFTREATEGGMCLSQELKIRAAKHPNIRFAECHITYHPRTGTSKLSAIGDGWRNLVALFKLRTLI